jgi:hypothetical protein
MQGDKTKETGILIFWFHTNVTTEAYSS